MINTINGIVKEILNVNPKIMAKLIYKLRDYFEKVMCELEKMDEIYINAPEYELEENKENKDIIETPENIDKTDYKYKYQKLWDMHQDLLREFVKNEKT